jgi:hypothetical protein
LENDLLLAQIDCSKPKAEVICLRFNVNVYPTILYGDPLHPVAYTGEVDSESLSVLAHTLLKNQPICHAKYLDSCDQETRSHINNLAEQSKDELLLLRDATMQRIHKVWKDEFSMTRFNEKAVKLETQDYHWVVQLLEHQYNVPIEETPFKYMLSEDDDDYDSADDDDDSYSTDEDDDDEQYEEMGDSNEPQDEAAALGEDTVSAFDDPADGTDVENTEASLVEEL